ncbi:MerR family transcriptional regulator [Dysosmobacter sp.]|uniref:MerR family transcriptional regulator n=1 Tax=Dysosmobacter sp. TaxID=2591382 RepID=UPI003A929D68
MVYSIQERSRLSGVTTRILRWYDQIGLLKPSRAAESGCRYYGDAEANKAHGAVANLTQEQYRDWTSLGREIQE